MCCSVLQQRVAVPALGMPAHCVGLACNPFAKLTKHDVIYGYTYIYIHVLPTRQNLRDLWLSCQSIFSNICQLLVICQLFVGDIGRLFVGNICQLFVLSYFLYNGIIMCVNVLCDVDLLEYRSSFGCIGQYFI